MASRFHVAVAAAAALLVAAPVAVPVSAQVPDNWDGLVRAKAKRLDAVYLLPQADFRGYTKVMLDRTEVAFRKNWKRDTSTPYNRISEQDAREILESARDLFQEALGKAYAKAGYQIVTQPAADVLRISTAVVNLDVEAPDLMTAGRSRSYSREAGSATLVVEARDSLSGALLGRAADADTTGDFGPYLRNRVTNAAEFERLFTRWAEASAQGLGKLKALSPIDAQGNTKAP